MFCISLQFGAREVKEKRDERRDARGHVAVRERILGVDGQGRERLREVVRRERREEGRDVRVGERVRLQLVVDGVRDGVDRAADARAELGQRAAERRVLAEEEVRLERRERAELVQDLADDLLVQTVPYRVTADPPLALRYLLRHEAVAWCVHDEDGERHWLPYCAGRRKHSEDDSDGKGGR